MAEYKKGLVSVTFRNKSIDEVIGIASKAGLDGIEWGSDIHVPVGDLKKAAYVKAKSASAGLEVFSYGSYYRAGMGQHFTEIAETAVVLGAKNIRVWAGAYGSDTTPDKRIAVVTDLKRICKKAAKCGLNVSVEYHQGTLTDEASSALLLAQQVEEDNFSLYWQPNQFRTSEDNIEALKTVLPYLSSIHTFAWTGSNRYLLQEHEAKWKSFIDIVKSDKKSHNFYLEFVKDDQEENLYSDAKALKKWLE